jgi:DNA polymerase I-like protein with 3'-5' exonuclease and polymerase domains
MPLAAPQAPTIGYELGYTGEPFHGTHENPLAFDTETDLHGKFHPGEVNNLALVQASDGERTALVHPKDLARFLAAHRDVPFVGHNIAFDYWVVDKALAGDEPARAAWRDKARAGLLHDTMLLDALVRLAEGKGETGDEKEKLPMRNLGEVARDYGGVRVSKEDPYRMKYSEIIGKRFSEVTDKGFWEYAARDAYATARAWPPLYRKALGIARRYAAGGGGGGGDGGARLRRWLAYGVLTERVQVQGAIALDAIGRAGMPFCPDAVAADAARWRPVVAECVAAIDKLRPAHFKRKGKGFELADKSGCPKTNQHDLVDALAEAGDKVKAHLPDFTAPQSTGKKARETGDAISRSTEDWVPYAPYDPFLGLWVRLADATKRLAFYAAFRPPVRDLFSALEPAAAPRVRSRYNPLMRTGRISAQDPNVTQFPRDPGFRGVFAAPPGRKLITADYAFVELRTLAATCFERFGYSVLADVIKAGVDPHAYTAAMVNGMKLDEFLALKKTDPAKFKSFRQSSKALNFGIPGGLGAFRLVEYAAANYGVTFTLAEAEAFRQKLVTEVYPELNPTDGYLADDTYGAIAVNAGLSRGEVLAALPGDARMREWLGRVLFRVAAGATTKADGTDYNPRFFSDCWDFLKSVGRRAPKGGPLSEATRERLLAGKGDMPTARELTSLFAVTLTGRVRSRVRYTASKNTCFQGLAADGIKLAAFRLVLEGYKVCGLIHDELVVEVEDRGEAANEAASAHVQAVMNTSMEEVLGGAVPSGTEAHVGDAWEK